MMQGGGTGRRRAGRHARVAALALVAALPGCSAFDTTKSKPVVDRPPPQIGAVGDLDTEALLRIAETAEASGLDATTVYRRLVERQPDQPGPRVQLARHLARAGDLAGAEVEYRRAAELAPGDLEARLGLAGTLYGLRRTRDAGAVYQTVLEGDPQNVRALNGLGAVEDGAGRHADAQARYRAVLAVDPADKSARNNLGLSLALTGQADEGVAILEKLVAEPDATAAHRANLERARRLRSGPKGRRPAAPPASASVE